MTYSPSIVSAALLTILAASPAISGEAATALVFTFDEGTGTTLANTGDLGAGSNGTVTGAQFSLDSAFDSGFSLHFDGETDYVAVPDSFDYGDKLTIDLWLKPSALDGQRAIYDDYGNPGVFLGISGGKLQWNISTGTHPAQGVGLLEGEICSNLWQHVAGTYDGSTLRAWVNGVEIGSVATSGAIIDNAGNATHIGADSGTPSLLEYSGKMDGFRLFLDNVPPPGPLWICGELSDDCAITSSDALIALRMAVGQIPDRGAADVDGSSVVTASDALAILRTAVGTIVQSNACNNA